MNSDIVLGVDFGTTNSVCAIHEHGTTEVITNSEGDRVTPSVVYFTKHEEQNQPLVGQAAENRAETDPDRVVRSVKRQLGKEDEEIEIGGITYEPASVAAKIIRKLRIDSSDRIEAANREGLKDIVITMPAYWPDTHRKHVKAAAEAAGFKNIRVIQEPAAAAISHGYHKATEDEIVGVFDLGGGTFDFAIVEVSTIKQAGNEYNIIAQSGDLHLGGDDWDNRIVEWMVENFDDRTGIDPREELPSDQYGYEHKVRQERLRKEAQRAKHQLSNDHASKTEIRIPHLVNIDGESKTLSQTLTHTNFKSLTRDLLMDTTQPITVACDDAANQLEGVSDFNPEDLDDILLVGGSTRMAQVQDHIETIFGQEPKKHLNPDLCVAKGAGIKGNKDDLLLLETTPLPLGVGIKGDIFKPMIERNTRIPASTTETFQTSEDSKTAVCIPIYQGEREIASENHLLKNLIIKDIPPGDEYSVHIDVTFEVRKNGIIHVSATESTSGKSVSVDIEDEKSLDEDFVEQQLKEAKENEKLDRERRLVIESKNEAEDATNEANDYINYYEHILQEDEKHTIKNHIERVKSIKRDENATVKELREATESLNKWVHKVGDRVRKSGAKPQSQAESLDNTGTDSQPDSTNESASHSASKSDHVTEHGLDTDDLDTVEAGGVDETPDDGINQNQEATGNFQEQSTVSEKRTSAHSEDNSESEPDEEGLGSLEINQQPHLEEDVGDSTDGADEVETNQAQTEPLKEHVGDNEDTLDTRADYDDPLAEDPVESTDPDDSTQDEDNNTGSDTLSDIDEQSTNQSNTQFSSNEKGTEAEQKGSGPGSSEPIGLDSDSGQQSSSPGTDDTLGESDAESDALEMESPPSEQDESDVAVVTPNPDEEDDTASDPSSPQTGNTEQKSQHESDGQSMIDSEPSAESQDGNEEDDDQTSETEENTSQLSFNEDY